MGDIQYLTVGHLSTKDLIRIFSKVAIDLKIAYQGTPCWTITTNDKYGKVYLHGMGYKAHRFFYAWLIGPLPIGQEHGELDHLCRNTRCVNPAHIELVSGRVNCLRGVGPTAKNARKTHCLKGHPLPTSVNYRNERVCGTCARDRLDRFAQKNPQRYDEIRNAAGRRYNERHPERRKEIQHHNNARRAREGYFQKRREAALSRET